MRMEYGMLGLGWKEKRRVFVGGRGNLNEGGEEDERNIAIAPRREIFMIGYYQI